MRKQALPLTKKRKSVFMHRLILDINNRRILTDHINGDRLDNRKENLRICTFAENSHNTTLNMKRIYSKYKGVSKYFRNKTIKWTSGIKYKDKTLFLGHYDVEEEAALAYNIAAKLLFGKFAKINNLPENNFKLAQRYIDKINKLLESNIIFSNNLRKYTLIRKDDLVRINLAWIFSLEQFQDELQNIKNDILIDFPEKRKKPPNNKYTIEQILPYIEKYSNIKYIAISNVEVIEDIEKFSPLYKKIKLVLKIESYKGYQNLNKLLDYLSKIQPPICQIDTEDLQRDLEQKNINENVWEISKKINIICKNYKDGKVFNLIGVVFTDLTEEDLKL